MKKIAGFAAFAACAGAAAPCFAQSKTVSAARALHSHADENSDGNVSYAELARYVHASVTRQVAKRFKQLDRNGDGRCTRAEVNLMDAKRFARFDRDGDGAFTAAELAEVMRPQVTTRLGRVYIALDLNRDGNITLAELAPEEKKAPVAVAKGKSSSGKL